MRERSTTKRSNMLPWMEDILNEYSTTQNSNRNRNKQNVRTTTPTSIRKTTTINSFWHDWSATQSNDIWQTTTDQPELDPWMKDILDEHTTTPTPYLKDNYVQTPLVVTEMPSWMRQVLNEYSSTTTRNGLPLPIQFESSNTKESTFGGGIGGGIDFGGGILNFGANIGVLHQSTKHRYLMCIVKNEICMPKICVVCNSLYKTIVIVPLYLSNCPNLTFLIRVFVRLTSFITNFQLTLFIVMTMIRQN